MKHVYPSIVYYQRRLCRKFENCDVYLYRNTRVARYFCIETRINARLKQFYENQNRPY